MSDEKLSDDDRWIKTQLHPESVRIKELIFEPTERFDSLMAKWFKLYHQIDKEILQTDILVTGIIQ